MIHASAKALRVMCNCHTYREAGIQPRSEVIDPFYCCDDCHRAMGSKLRPNEPIDKDKFYLGQYWASDWSGEKVPSLIKGYRYAGVFIERKSRYKESYFAVHKDTSTLCQIIRNWDREHLSRWKYIYLTCKQLDNFFFHLKCDNLEYRIPEVLDLLYSIGVRPHFTCPGHSSENGLAERAIGVIDTKERTFRIAENKPDEFWACAWRIGTQVSNIIPYQYRGRWHADPYTHYFGKMFNYKRLRRPLQKCFVLIRERVKSTEVLKSYLANFVGYSPDSNAYEVYIPATGMFTTSGDIHFPHATESEEHEDTTEQEVSSAKTDIHSTSVGSINLERPQQLQAQDASITESERSQQLQAKADSRIPGVTFDNRLVEPLFITDWNLWFSIAMKLMENF